MLTYVDEATGEHVVLSAAQLGEWSARTAGMLRDGYGLKAGDRAAVLLPPHWQTAAVLLGAWSIGVTISFRPWATAGLTPHTDEGSQTFDALFVTSDRQQSWLETMPQAWHRFILGLAPDAGPTSEVPHGYHDYVVEALRYSAAAPAYQSIEMSGPASPDGTTYRQLAEIAKGVAAKIGLTAGDRLRVDAGGSEQPVNWLLAPLTVGASIVIVANAKPGPLTEPAVTHVLR